MANNLKEVHIDIAKVITRMNIIFHTACAMVPRPGGEFIYIFISEELYQEYKNLAIELGHLMEEVG